MSAPRFAGQAGRPSKVPVSVIPGGLGTPIPDAPPTLGAIGQDAWLRYWTVGRAWLSNEAHYGLMTLLCEAIEHHARLLAESKKRSTKLMVRGSMGQDRVNPIFDAVEKSRAAVTDLFIKLRFQPAEQKQKVASTKSRLDAMREAQRASG